jgi:hypothetical protein
VTLYFDEMWADLWEWPERSTREPVVLSASVDDTGLDCEVFGPLAWAA